MGEFTIQPTELPMNDPNTEQRFKNVKEIKVGNGRWKQDADALRLYENGVCTIYLGI
jgi:hypothetical protein